MKSPLAVCTMYFDEPEFLPIWTTYYASQVGLENCFFIDHGSSVEYNSQSSGSNLIRIPRSPQDEVQRVNAISGFVNYLLNYYDHVIYCDIDEMLVANPEKYTSLIDFCASQSAPVVSAVGLNVHHVVDEEPSFQANRGVLVQRRWARFVGPMCKPLIVSNPVQWNRGFHSCNFPIVFGDIFLFHLRSFDKEVSLARLSRQRSIPRRTKSDEIGAAHHRVSDDTALSWMKGAAALPKVDLATMSIETEPVSGWIKRVVSPESCSIDQEQRAMELWRVPDRYIHIL